jgi:DNA-binding winged helix-turn-helix (wHTH) protein/tetratricopeptide (TPR) repeat protein
MDTSAETLAFFGDWRFDPGAGRLFQQDVSGAWREVPIGSRAAAILALLLERRGAVVSKKALFAAAWPGAHVDASNLTVQIAALRRIIDQGSSGESCIQTVSGRGYRLPPALTATQRPPAPDRRQSTIIFPFDNSSSSDAAQDSLAAEITRHLTERISRAGTGPVIAETVAGVPRGSLPDLHSIGRDHDVHFALTGSARRQDGHLIASAVLYDTAEARAVWGQWVNVPDGPGAVTTIGQVIYESWWQASVDGEAWHAGSEHPDHLDKRDLLLMALATPLQTPTKAHYLERMILVDRALSLDPNYLLGLERRARLHAEFVLWGYSSDPAGDLAIATKAADHALTIDPNRLNSLRVKATVLRAKGDWTAAEALLRRVLTMQPTEAKRHDELGQCLMAEGRHQEALVSFQTAKRFAGGADTVYSYDANIAMANLALGQLAEAIAAARLAIAEMPPDTGRVGEFPWLALIAATSASADEERAHTDLQQYLAAPRSWHSVTEVQRWLAFSVNPKLIDGLRLAGMPAE